MGTLWTCRVCGRRFRRANTYHSCGRYSLEQHFSRKEPIARHLYDRLVDTLQEFGSVTAHPVKTRIVFQAEVQFAAAVIHKDWREGYFWLRRQAGHPQKSDVRLSPHELIVVQGMADGLIDQQIAVVYGMKLCMVRFFVTNVKEKLNPATREQVVARAVSLGLIQVQMNSEAV